MSVALRWICAGMFAVTLAASVSQAGSIWAKASEPRALHSDDTARKIGDILTIVIEERTIIENETTRGLSKKSTRTAAIAADLPLLKMINGLTGELFALHELDVNTSGESKFDGDATYDSDRSLQDQMTVTVADVLPNGNLVVIGTRERVVEGDRQTVKVSGVVRPSDIAFDNKVRSDLVAEFKIVFEQKGRENRSTKPGWLDWILNITNPF